MRYATFSILLFTALVFQSCEHDPLEVDVSGHEAEVKISRLDSAFFNADFSHPDSTNQALYQKFGEFYAVYLEDILRTGPVGFSQSLATAAEFTNDPYMYEAWEAILEVHNPRMNEYQTELNRAFSYYHYYFPDSLIPEVIFYHSGFNFGVFSIKEAIGVGGEWFLGKDHRITAQVPFPQYRKEKMDPAYLVPNVVKDWSNKVMYRDIEGENLLENLVYFGKIMYLTDALMPAVADSIKMNWRSAQLNWCRDNEFRIWTELASDKQTLYETRTFEVKKWVTDGPFTSGLPQESPGMVGVWVGWMMVRDHHRRHPELTLPQVLNTEAKEILRSYNPKR